MSVPPTDEPLITARQIGERLSVNRHTVFAWHAKGIIPGYRIGPKMIRFLWSEVWPALKRSNSYQDDGLESSR